MVRSRVIAIAGALLCCGRTGQAQTSAAKPAVTENVAVEPIECWWRTSASAVRVGELFDVVLTCAVLDTAATTVVPDQTRLDPSVLQLVPFEVTGGTQAADLRTTSRRFFQYEYTLRYLGEDFGKDVSLPSLSLAYRVQNRVEQNAAAVESRDRQYILPSQLVRIQSLVPVSASDIRDRAPDTFRSIAARRFRGNVLRVTALALFALAAIVLVWAIVHAITRKRRGSAVVAPRHASDGAILGHAARQLTAVGRQRHVDGWTPDLAARALGALRIAASYATAGQVSQSPRTPGVEAAEGQLVVTSPLRPGRAALVSASATAGTVQREINRPETQNGHRSAALEDLHLALSRMDIAAYGRDGIETLDLDEALASGMRGVATVKRRHGWVAKRASALARSAADLRSRVWAR